MRKLSKFIIAFIVVLMCGCTRQKEHIAPAVDDADSAAVMNSYGINMLVSDSGVIKYRIVTERCITNENIHPKRNVFDKGAFFTEYDENFHVKAYVQADTAYQYTEDKLLELRGRVRIINKDGLVYRGEQLYWDQNKHEFYSHTYSYLKTPERTLEGRYFRSNEQMTKYYISNSKGIFQQADLAGGSSNSSGSNNSNVPDSVQPPVRQPMTPFKKR